MAPQRTDASLTLIVPRIALRSGQAIGGLLAKLAGRGTVRTFDMQQHSALAAFEAWQASLLESCGLLTAAQHLPSAPLSHAGESLQIDAHYWAHLECVHFAAGLNDIAGVRLRDEALLTQAEHAQLSARLGDHLLGDGCELHANGARGWLLKFPRTFNARTVAPERAFSGPLNQSLPSGEHGAELRRLMTELQMLLHEHPINEARSRRGLPSANAVWLWGIGSVSSTVVQQELPLAYGSRSFLKGLYLVHGQSVRAEAADVHSLLNDVQSHGRVIAVTEVADLNAFELQWLTPLAREIRRGTLARFTVYLDQWRISLSRHDIFRFWRKPRPTAQWGI